ncbi:glycosyltransferase family 4 protein [Desulfobacterota bacterium AH_259_B03_O07]|nr:glycosyltransferase family 4 protein [Desulfobacterota bacterium AH_259_B03_O07]
MHLLIVTHNFPPLEGGITTHTLEMVRNLVKLGQEPVVLAPRIGDWKTIDLSLPFPVARMPQVTSKYVRFLFTALYTLLATIRWRPKVIYATHWRNCGLAVSFVSMLTRVPFFQAIHGTEVLVLEGTQASRRLFGWITRRTQGFVVLAKYQEMILRRLGVPEEKIYISLGGVDLMKFDGNDRAAIEVVNARYGLNGKKAILTVARLVERKGQDMVIAALPQVLEAVPNAVYLVVGRGPMQERLKRMAWEKGVQDKVIFCGFVPDEELPAYYKTCDVFVMPNREIGGDTEGFGIVFVEAGACGKPVIGGRSGGVVEVIEDGITGFLVDSLDPRELSQALVQVLTDESMATRMGRAGQARVVEKYDNYRVTSEILSHFLTKTECAK